MAGRSVGLPGVEWWSGACGGGDHWRAWRQQRWQLPPPSRSEQARRVSQRKARSAATGKSGSAAGLVPASLMRTKQSAELMPALQMRTKQSAELMPAVLMRIMQSAELVTVLLMRTMQSA